MKFKRKTIFVHGLRNFCALWIGSIPYCLAVAGEQAVVGWGNNFYGQLSPPAGLSNIVALAAGAYHGLALKSDGTVVAWGYNGDGQANVPAGLSNVTAIAAGNRHSLALLSEGTVVAWGYNNAGQTNVPGGLSNIVAIAAYDHNLALKADGTVGAWGNGAYGQTNVPPGLSGVHGIAAGFLHSLALKNDGTVVAWGAESVTDVPLGLSNVITIAAGRLHSLALKTNGIVVAWGIDNHAQTNVPSGLSNVVAIAAGSFHSLALKNEGTVIAWGNNFYGQLHTPAGLSNVVSIAAGDYFNLSLGACFPPINDECAGAISITDGLSYPVNTACATSIGDPSAVSRGVWYKFTPDSSGTVVVNTTGNDPYREVAVYAGGCDSLFEDARGDYSTSFFGMAGETYWILVGSYALETSINTVLTVNDCRAPSNLATATSYIEEPDGIRVFYQVSVSGTPPFTYNWTFSDGTNFANAPSFISRFYGPFDPFPEGFSVTVANACGNSGTGGSLPPPCGAICLSLGVPNTRTGTNGSGSNSYSLPSSCGQFATGSSRWFLVSKLTNAAGIAFVSADGSAPDTMLGVFRGGIDPANLFPLTCSVSSNNRPARVEFETRPGSNYWLAVITTNPAALKLTYGYDVKFDTFTLNGPGGAMELRSAPLPSLQYQLVATTNLNANPPNWTVLMTTNFSGVGSASNNVLRFIETNVSNFTGRFYRITLIP